MPTAVAATTAHANREAEPLLPALCCASIARLLAPGAAGGKPARPFANPLAHQRNRARRAGSRAASGGIPHPFGGFHALVSSRSPDLPLPVSGGGRAAIAGQC